MLGLSDLVAGRVTASRLRRRRANGQTTTPTPIGATTKRTTHKVADPTGGVHPVLMADERLQQLRRAWDGGDREALVRLLRARMRAGELSEERVLLAAWLESRAASVLFSDLPLPESKLQRLHVAAGLGRLGSVRIGLAAVRARTLTELATPAWLAAEAWAASPCDALKADFDSAHAEALAADTTGVYKVGVGAVVGLVSSTAWKREISEAIEHQIRREVAEELYQSRHTTNTHPAQLDFVRRIQRQCELRLYARVREEVLPWALGLRDPLAELVAARPSTE